MYVPTVGNTLVYPKRDLSDRGGDTYSFETRPFPTNRRYNYASEKSGVYRSISHPSHNHDVSLSKSRTWSHFKSSTGSRLHRHLVYQSTGNIDQAR